MKKSLPFLIYCCIIITAIILLLVFAPKKKDEDKNILPSNNASTNTETNTNNSNTSVLDNDQIYATELTINLPDTIEILVNNKVELLDGFVTVTPVEAKSKIICKIGSYYNSDINGLKLENLTLIGTIADTYKLIVSVPKKTGMITKSVIVKVYEETEYAHLKQLKNSSIIGENLDICSYFEFNTNKEYNVVTNDNIAFENNKLIPIVTGEGEINVEYTVGNLKYVYLFYITVINKPEYEILVYDIENKTIEIESDKTTKYEINYSIRNREEENVYQPIYVEIEDEQVVILEYVEYPLIKIKLIQKGVTKLRIICSNNTNIFIEITVIVK